MKYLRIILICLFLTGCSASTLASGIMGAVTNDSAPSLSVDAQVGDKTTQLGNKHKLDASKNEGIITVTSDSSTNSKEIKQADKVVINEKPSVFFMLLMVLGWLCPSPQEIYREIKSWFTK